MGRLAPLPSCTRLGSRTTGECTPCCCLFACTPVPRLRRLREQGGSVVVDVRSASRVGKGDLGANAARIRSYLAALRAELGQQGGA
jgi:hypothetical protein